MIGCLDIHGELYNGSQLVSVRINKKPGNQHPELVLTFSNQLSLTIAVLSEEAETIFKTLKQGMVTTEMKNFTFYDKETEEVRKIKEDNQISLP